MGLDPVQWVFLGLELIGNVTLLKLVTWFFAGGWKFVLRTIGFDIDLLLVSVISRVYSYFLQVLNGTLFNEAVVNELLKNIYVFVGVIMFFRLMMLIIKYLINPDLVSDNKLGVSSLIKRVIIGLMGILFIPSLFDFALKFQADILEDNIIQQIIIPKDMLQSVKAKQADGGKYIGTYVLAGFISPGTNASNRTRKEYENALADGDLSSLSTLRLDGFIVGDYEYDYFYLLSTFCLCYVLYILIKYVLDVLTRFLRLLVYQLLAPVAMIEYMINGSDDGVFKTWRSGVLGTYFMLFVRVLALWLVVFITVLMAAPADNEYVHGSLLATDDRLLRALIIMAVIGFMMDLPKIIGQIFGLDLEQEGNAGGILKQVGGMLKGVALGALAIGGAAIGGVIGTGKALGKSANQAFGIGDKLKNKFNNSGLGQRIGNSSAKFQSSKNGNRAQRFMNAAKANNVRQHNKAAWSGVIGAALGSNSFTGSAYKGYSGQSQQQKDVDNKADQNAREAARDSRQEQMLKNQEKQNLLTVAVKLLESGIELTPAELAVRTKPVEVGTLNANVQGRFMGAMSGVLTASDVKTDGTLTASGEAKTRREVEDVVKKTFVDNGVPVSDATIQQHVDTIMDSAVPSVDSEGTVRLNVDTSALAAATVGMGDQEITQVINQVQGTRANAELVDLTQKINQEVNKISRNTEETNVYAQISTEHIEKVRQDVEQQVDISRNINTNIEETKIYSEMTAQNTEDTKNSLKKNKP